MATIFFATNRAVQYETSKSGRNFGDEISDSKERDVDEHRYQAGGPQCFRVGKVEVTLNGDPYEEKKDEKVWEVGECTLYPEKLDVDDAADVKLGSASMFEDLRARLKNDACDVIIFLHGFASSFQSAARRAAQLQHLYGADGRDAIVVMFSWPSDGKVFPSFNYFSDRHDAAASGLAMARALDRLTTFLTELRRADYAEIMAARRRGEVPDAAALRQCFRKLHLVAHSMGNWALRHALLSYADINNGQIPRILDQAFLMAADEDADAMDDPAKLKHLLELSNRIHIYHARDDVALEVSSSTKSNPSRLGAHGPDDLDRLHERVVAIDCSRVSDTVISHGHHQYYRLRREVVHDVIATLKGEPEDDRPGRVTKRPGRSWRIVDMDNKAPKARRARSK